MTNEQRLSEMEETLEKVLENQEKQNKKLDEVLSAIQGNQMSGEAGIAKRLKILEDKEERRSLEGARNSVFVKIITWLIGIIAGLVIAYMFNQAYNRPVQSSQSLSTQSK